MARPRRTPKAPDQRSEIEIQTLFRSRARMHCPEVAVVAVPNAGKRGQWAMNQALREGMRAGFPDVMCIAANRIAFIEFKAHAGTIDPRQQGWIDWLNARGFPAVVARCPDAALRFLEANGFPFLFPVARAA